MFECEAMCDDPAGFQMNSAQPGSHPSRSCYIYTWSAPFKLVFVLFFPQKKKFHPETLAARISTRMSFVSQPN